MATIPRSEYLGFSVNETTRAYQLKVTQASGEERVYTVSIKNRAFLEQRVRYQDGPAICFLKLERELAACGDGAPPLNLRVTDTELADFLEQSSGKASPLRPRPEVKP